MAVMRRVMVLLPATVLLSVAAGPLWAYEPPLSEIYTRILLRSPQVSAAVIKTRTIVFDAGRTVVSASALSEMPPAEVPERGFRQDIYWIRDRLLAVETFDDQGRLLHFYHDEGTGATVYNLTREREFTVLDTLHPFLPFLASTAAGWNKGLQLWGVLPTQATFHRSPKGVLSYELQEAPRKRVRVDTEHYRPALLETTVDRSNRASVLRIEFSNFLLEGDQQKPEDNLIFPGSTHFLLDGVLFKEVIVQDLRANPGLATMPITRLREKAAELRLRQPPERPERGESAPFYQAPPSPEPTPAPSPAPPATDPGSPPGFLLGAAR